MKVEKSDIVRLKITGGDRLDPVTVFIEDFGVGKGKITIKCYSQSWSAGWGAMGDNNVESFFLSCDEHYIANKLSSTPASIEDFDTLADTARAHVISNRRHEYETKEITRELYDLCDSLENAESLRGIESEMNQIFGSEWWYNVPDKPNPDYEYLCRIILCVQDALKN